MKLNDWYNKMNPRERVLSLAVAVIILILFNFLFWSWLLGAITSARDEVAKREASRKEQTIFMNEHALWQKRADWLQQHQPVVKSPAEASTLLEQVKQIAGKYNVLLENPQIGAGENTPQHQSVFASFDTKSPWPPLVHFLYDVQQPEAFVVFENVNLAIDPGDPTQMRGKFKLARWFAPGGAKR